MRSRPCGPRSGCCEERRPPAGEFTGFERVKRVGGFDEGERVADPLPQALALTAIVIAFGITAFLLAVAYRSWVLNHDDEVEDDVEDRRIARLGEAEVARWWRWWR